MWYLIVSIPDLCTFTYFVPRIQKSDTNFGRASGPGLKLVRTPDVLIPYAQNPSTTILMYPLCLWVLCFDGLTSLYFHALYMREAKAQAGLCAPVLFSFTVCQCDMYQHSMCCRNLFNCTEDVHLPKYLVSKELLKVCYLLSYRRNSDH